MPTERLDKVVSAITELSRKAVRDVIKAGRVAVDGQTVTDCSVHIDPDRNAVAVDGIIGNYKRYVYFMINKPEGVISASNDKSRETVVDLIKVKRDGLFPVGRLDKSTTGLLIITDDGDFGHKVINPKSGIEKEYVAVLDKLVKDEDIAALSEGCVLADGTRCRDAAVKILSDDRKTVSITVTEGKYHEIKRMFGTVGIGVNELKRIRIGKLTLDGEMLPGEYRELNGEELQSVFEKHI